MCLLNDWSSGHHVSSDPTDRPELIFTATQTREIFKVSAKIINTHYANINIAKKLTKLLLGLKNNCRPMSPALVLVGMPPVKFMQHCAKKLPVAHTLLAL